MAFAPSSSRGRPSSARSAGRGGFMPDNLDVMPTAHLLELKRSVDGKLAMRDQGDTGSFGDDVRRSQGRSTSLSAASQRDPVHAFVARSVAGCCGPRPVRGPTHISSQSRPPLAGWAGRSSPQTGWASASVTGLRSRGWRTLLVYGRSSVAAHRRVEQESAT